MKKWNPVLILIFILPLFSFLQDPGNKFFEISKNLEIFTNLYKELNLYYVDELDPAQLMRTGIDAMLADLDPYTNYISESQIESYRFMAEGRFEGIGAETEMVDQLVTIVKVYEGSPAEKAELKVGDQIVAIGGKSVKGKTIDDVKNLMKGASGTSLILTIDRPGREKVEDATITRGKIDVINVPYSGLLTGDIGYIVLTQFTENAGKNIGNAYKKLKKENPELKGVILDLRSNPGGLLREAINICNLFIPKNKDVVITRGKIKDWDRTYKTTANPLDEDIPLTVLINNSSASASEIVSGVIQDYDRGVVIGQRSFGKGLVQNTRNIGYNSRLKITTSKYYIPSGRCIQSIEYAGTEHKDIPDSLRAQFKTKNNRPVLDGGGVTPDIRIPEKKRSEFTKQLIKEHIIFKYANNYVLSNPEISKPEEFVFTNYSEFIEFAKSEDFHFVSSISKKVKDITNSLSSKGYSDQIKSELESVHQSLFKEDMDNFDDYKAEIISEIELEITKRYFNEAERIKYKLNKDPEILEAIAVIEDPERYQSILQ